MTRKVFFSFHYEEDCTRAAIVRNHNVTKDNSGGYIDAADWEKIKNDEDKIKKWIADQLIGTSVTVVLIGEQTSGRKWIKYELSKSIEKGNALLGIYIHNLEDMRTKKKANKGDNPLDSIYLDEFSNKKASSIYKTYDWVNDKGYDNFEKWIEEAHTIKEKSK